MGDLRFGVGVHRGCGTQTGQSAGATGSSQQQRTGNLSERCLAGASLITTGGVFLCRALLVHVFTVLAGSRVGTLWRSSLWHGRLHNDTTECHLGCWHPGGDRQHWFLLTPRLGAQRTALLGGLLSACFVLGIVVAGALDSEALFRTALFLFGAAAGISTNASLTLMLGLTSPLMAGTFLGVWGLAQAYARGLATISGGALLSGFGTLTGSQNSFAAYAGVFIIQAIGLLVAGLLLLRVDTKLFQRRVEKALSSILSSELD